MCLLHRGEARGEQKRNVASSQARHTALSQLGMWDGVASGMIGSFGGTCKEAIHNEWLAARS